MPTIAQMELEDEEDRRRMAVTILGWGCMVGGAAFVHPGAAIMVLGYLISSWMKTPDEVIPLVGQESVEQIVRAVCAELDEVRGEGAGAGEAGPSDTTGSGGNPTGRDPHGPGGC